MVWIEKSLESPGGIYLDLMGLMFFGWTIQAIQLSNYL